MAHAVESNQILFVTCAEYYSEMLTFKPLTNNTVLRNGIELRRAKNNIIKEQQ